MLYIRNQKRFLKSTEKHQLPFKKGFIVYWLNDKNITVSVVQYKQNDDFPSIDLFKQVGNRFNKENNIIIEFFQVTENDGEDVYEVNEIANIVAGQLIEIKNNNIIDPNKANWVDFNEQDFE